jgi:HK97 family phage major capsid protein
MKWSAQEQESVTYQTLKVILKYQNYHAGAGHGWAATETAAVEEGNPVTAEITMSPKKGGRFVDVSRTLMIQGDPNAEKIFTDDLIQALAVAADYVILHGSGADGQPQGIVGTANVGNVPGTNLGWAGALAFKKALNLANVRIGERYYIANPTTVADLQAREKVTGYPQFLCGEDMKMAGYQMLETNQAKDAHIIYGAFNHCLVGLWGGVDLTIDPYTQRTSGIVRLIADQLMDVAIRHAGAFAVCSDFS